MGLYAGIEAGGTKFVCAVASGPDEILAETRFPTSNPAETIGRTVDFFREFMHQTGQQLTGIGIGSFGPLDLNPASPAYGSITSTPKPGWQHVRLLQNIRDGLGLRAVIDTDVNAAAVGEGRWGAAQGLNNIVYLTIGTGIGGGALVNGETLRGLIHPEMGHFRIPHDSQQDPFPGICPYHLDCFEGLASGPAIQARWGETAVGLPEDHPAWELEAHYIALALQALITILSPQRIILGGGVMQRKQLLPLIRLKTRAYLNGYVHSPAVMEQIDSYIVPPDLGTQAGVLGAIALAMRSVPEI